RRIFDLPRSRGAEEPRSRGAEEPRSRAAEQPRSRAAGQPGSRHSVSLIPFQSAFVFPLMFRNPRLDPVGIDNPWHRLPNDPMQLIDATSRQFMSKTIPHSRSDSAPQWNAWSILGWLGIVFVVLGFGDIALGIYPTQFGNQEWEFGMVSALLN